MEAIKGRIYVYNGLWKKGGGKKDKVREGE